jgi:hypothetical protein
MKQLLLFVLITVIAFLALAVGFLALIAAGFVSLWDACADRSDVAPVQCLDF